MNYFLLLNWILSVTPHVPKLIELGKKAYEADGLRAHWDAIVEFGNYVVPLLETLPLEQETANVQAIESAEEQVTAAGLNLDDIKSLLPLLETVLSLWLNRKKFAS